LLSCFVSDGDGEVPGYGVKKEDRVLPTKKKNPFEVIENSRRTYLELETPPPN